MFILIFEKEQAFLMAAQEFNYFMGADMKVSDYHYRMVEDHFEMEISDSVLEDFLSFLQDQKWYVDHFLTTVIFNHVRGFKSLNGVARAIEFFNKRHSSFYVDPSCEVEEIACSDGIVYAPLIVEEGLDDIFWGFVENSPYLLRSIKIGRERCRID